MTNHDDETRLLSGRYHDAVLLAKGFVEITEAEGVRIDLRYASTNNFLGRNLYGSFNRLFLHRVAAKKLRRAVGNLQTRKPDWRLLVFDGLRPNRIQRVFWESVRGTPHQIYVGDPAVGSIHAYGLAVDVSLADEDGREVDMGTPFDDFSPLAEPQREADFLASGALTATQMANRTLLRWAMTSAGFHELAIEWWHFDALPPDEVRRGFERVE